MQLEKVVIHHCHPKSVRVAIVMLVAVTPEVLLWISAFWGEEDPSFKKSICLYNT